GSGTGFMTLVSRNARWAEIDANAIERIARYGHQSGVQGQLFEEVLFNRITVWLRDPAGKAALGLTEFEGRLQFFPGHLIRDANGRQLTDGVIAIETGNREYFVVAVFEGKSGEYSASGMAGKK